MVDRENIVQTEAVGDVIGTRQNQAGVIHSAVRFQVRPVGSKDGDRTAGKGDDDDDSGHL